MCDTVSHDMTYLSNNNIQYGNSMLQSTIRLLRDIVDFRKVFLLLY